MELQKIQKLSKTLSEIENRTAQSKTLLKELKKKKRGVPVIGITGPPGAGKSTLIDRLIESARKEGKTVGVISVDPTSPFTGGAILGDRVRMQRHATDEGVFIRSVGSRGSHGGLSPAVADFILAFDAFGFDIILVETVGVGQTELDIVHLATITVVVLVPEAGDAVQTMKAGLMEIADIFVVNKADRPGAEEMKTMLAGSGETPVVLTEAYSGKGVEELWEIINK